MDCASKRSVRKLLQAVVAVCLFLSACAGVEDDRPANTQNAQGESAPSAVQGKHCTLELEPVLEGEPTPTESKKVAAPRCFETYAEAIEYATKGAIKLPSGAGPEAVHAQTTLPGSASLIGTDYVDYYYGGNSFTYYGTKTCADGAVYKLSPLPSGYDNKVSSSKSWCNHSFHYDNPTYNGTSIDCGTGCKTFPSSMNDRTSSIMWKN